MNLNEDVKLIKMCKNYLEMSYSLFSNDLFKFNNGSKEIIASLGRIDHNERKSWIARNVSDEVIVENNDSSLPDYGETTSMLLFISEIADDKE